MVESSSRHTACGKMKEILHHCSLLLGADKARATLVKDVGDAFSILTVIPMSARAVFAQVQPVHETLTTE